MQDNKDVDSLSHTTWRCQYLSLIHIYEILNKKSGLLGISGVSSDKRDVEELSLIHI